jgi:hypothetical protein
MNDSKTIDSKRALHIVGVLLCMLVTAGCESQTVTHDEAQNVLLGRMDVRRQLDLTQTQLNATVASLNDINGKQSDDLVSAFKKYGDQVDLLETSIADLSRATSAAKAEAQAYFDTAATKIALINDPDLKARATNRRQKAIDLADAVDGDTRTVDLAYRLFLQRLRDIQAYLAADLTSGCVRSIQDQFTKTDQDVAPLKAKSDQLAYDLELGNELMNTGDVQPATASTTMETPTSLPATTTAP